MMILVLVQHSHTGADELGDLNPERSKEAMQTEVWVINQETRTCGQCQRSSHPHIHFPRTAAHRKSKSAHKLTSASVHGHIKK